MKRLFITLSYVVNLFRLPRFARKSRHDYESRLRGTSTKNEATTFVLVLVLVNRNRNFGSRRFFQENARTEG